MGVTIDMCINVKQFLDPWRSILARFVKSNVCSQARARKSFSLYAIASIRVSTEGIIAAEVSTLFLTICFSRTSPFPAALCIAERQLDFGGVRTDFQIYYVF